MSIVQLMYNKRFDTVVACFGNMLYRQTVLLLTENSRHTFWTSHRGSSDVLLTAASPHDWAAVGCVTAVPPPMASKPAALVSCVLLLLGTLLLELVCETPEWQRHSIKASRTYFLCTAAGQIAAGSCV